MSKETQAGFGVAVLAIAGMIVVSSAGAMASLLVMDRDTTAAVHIPSRGSDSVGLHPAKFVVADPFVRVVADWTDPEEAADADTLEIAGFPHTIEAIEIAFPLLTLLIVVVAAQRFSEFEPGETLPSPQMQHRLSHVAPVQQLPGH